MPETAPGATSTSPPSTPPTMSVVAHLTDLRRCLIRALSALLVCAVAAFYFSDHLLRVFHRPLSAPLVFLSPEEALWADLKLSLFFGLLAAFPVIVYQAWAFVAPGLHVRERRYALPVIAAAVLLFFLGVAFCYFVALPFALDFLVEYGRRRGIEPQISVSNYVDFQIKFLLAFGLIFDLPAVMLVLAKMGWLTAEFLRQKRRYAIFLCFLAAAILTPTPDIFNQTLMAVPLILLYEIGLIAVRIFGRRYD